jgi:hypothetical protein
LFNYEKEEPVRRLMLHAAAVLSLALLAGTVQAGKTAKPKPAESCGDYGTSVDFFKTPSDAATQAKKDQKLVMVLHVSGNFENPDFT